MISANILRTTTFRLAIIYLALFGASVVAVLGFVYWSTTGYIARQTDAALVEEVEELRDLYLRRGAAELTRLVDMRSRDRRSGLYLLIAGHSIRLAGNLDVWPLTAEAESPWIDFRYERRPPPDFPGSGRDVEPGLKPARALSVQLPGGLRLLVGRDVAEQQAVVANLQDALFWSIGLTLALGLGGGLLVSRNALRRVDAITEATRDIVAGDLSRRLPVGRGGDELDRLSASLNDMFDQIERLMHGMREVSDNVAHDLRTPLNRLRTRLEMTLMEPPSLDRYRDTLIETVEEADRIVATFNSILAIARMESGATSARFEQVDLGALVRDVAELYQPVAEERQLALTHDEGDGVVVQGDPSLLFQALGNLVDNAIKYAPDGGHVTLAAERMSDGRARLVVSDDGPGIPEEERARVLERFVRLDQSRRAPGTGLGLSLVRAVAQLHGAELVLDDARPGLRVELRLTP